MNTLDKITLVPTSQIEEEPTEAVAGLAASMAEVGQLTPILLDKTGKRLDGRDRLLAAKHNKEEAVLGLRIDLEGLAAEVAAIQARLVGKQRTPFNDGRDFSKWKQYREQQHPDTKAGGKKTKGKQSPNPGFCRYAEPLTGRSKSSIAALIQISEIPAIEQEQIETFTTIRENKEKLLQLAQYDPEDAESEGITRIEVAIIWNHHPTWNLQKCWHQAKYEKIKKSDPPQLCLDDDSYKLIEADFYDPIMQMEPESVDAVISDIPWEKSFLSRLNDLTAAITHVLKPGKPAIIMYGQEYFNRVMHAFEQSGLQYHWILADDQGDGLELKNHGHHIYNHWKPIIVYSKGNFDHAYVRDIFRSAGMGNKSHHPHQQGQQLFDWLVEKFTKVGDLVLEPFLGSGTTMLACMKKGRRCTGIDVDLKPAKHRIAKEGKGVTKIESE